MNISRRYLMTGLAATLSVLRIPGVSALEETYRIEDEFDDYEYRPYIEYLEVGERDEMLGGPATEPGWYLHPACIVGCCVSKGPFAIKEAAEEADRIFWAEIAKNSRNRKKGRREMEEILPF